MAHLGGVASPGRQEIGWTAFDRSSVGGGTIEGLPVLLYPFRGAGPPDVTVKRQPGPDTQGVIYFTVEHLGVVDHFVISDGQDRSFGGGEIQTDARCALVRTGYDGSPASFAAVGARRLTFRGTSLLPSPQPTDATGHIPN